LWVRSCCSKSEQKRHFSVSSDFDGQTGLAGAFRSTVGTNKHCQDLPHTLQHECKPLLQWFAPSLAHQSCSTGQIGGRLTGNFNGQGLFLHQQHDLATKATRWDLALCVCEGWRSSVLLDASLCKRCCCSKVPRPITKIEQNAAPPRFDRCFRHAPDLDRVEHTANKHCSSKKRYIVKTNTLLQSLHPLKPELRRLCAKSRRCRMHSKQALKQQEKVHSDNKYSVKSMHLLKCPCIPPHSTVLN